MQYLSIVYRLLITFWVGGAALFTFVLTPTLFKTYDRDTAGTIVGVLFPGYFKVGLICGVLALGCLLFTREKRWLASSLIIVAMLVVTSLQAFVIEPKAAALKKEIPSFVTTPSDHPLRQQFKKLHGLSAAGNLGVIGGGIALIILL
ncbi:MAG: DUF4149 domain-containing protein [Geobacter sp.]|nr:DUF4149 domain-containing protein [Geobacter sp.]